MKCYIGPVTKNTIDTVIQFSLDYGTEFVFIPSRRQIEYNGGYVENFTTSEFYNYVKSKNNTILIERDHGGPGQGKIDDDGFESLNEDCKYFDIIHIDPWKKYPKFEDAVEWTLKLINFCYSINNKLEYEIGTEEGIRPICVEELDEFVEHIKRALPNEIFSQIKFLVIQCGTKLLEQSNIGIYDSDKLDKMLQVCHKHNLISKEHNGDWISYDIIQKKEKAGLQCINIAPEFGEIESSTIINRFKENEEDLNTFFQICYESNAWKKWVSSDFDPLENKEKLIKICGHYNLTHTDFIKIKSKYANIDEDICKAIKYRLMELLGIYTVRKSCIMCNELLHKEVLQTDCETPICYSFFETIQPSYFIPYNIYICDTCNTVQNKYLCDLSLLYKVNHIDNFGQVKHNMHTFFANFIVSNKDITGTIEIGACHDYLSRLILSSSEIKNITIIDPSFGGDTRDLNIIDKYFEECDILTINANTIIMSSVFEHFYWPLDILKKLQASENIKYIYINHPNLDFAIENNVHINLTAEHTFYINNQCMTHIFSNFGFEQTNIKYFDSHTICYEFTRNNTTLIPMKLKNDINNFNKYIEDIRSTVDKLNNIVCDNEGSKFYMWPASMHLVPLFINGFNYNKLSALLDNSPNKIGKYFYGYNLICKSFKDIIEISDENTFIFLGGADNYRMELNLSTFKGTIVYI
jgi:fructose/tagatose bisphosphate aldolase